jgi:hypothetical protein
MRLSNNLFPVIEGLIEVDTGPVFLKVIKYIIENVFGCLVEQLHYSISCPIVN